MLVPVYNGAATLTESLDSAFNQTFADLEVIVVDDGSTDDTRGVLSAIDDPRLRILPSTGTRRGPAAARNRAAAASRGDYLATLDADDLWTTDKLEDQLATLEANPRAAVAHSFTDYIDEVGNVLGSAHRFVFQGNVLPDLLVSQILVHGSNALIRRSAFEEVGGFDETLLIGEDWELYIRLAARYDYAFVPKMQILYRQSPGSLTSRRVDLIESDTLSIVDRIYSGAPADLQYLRSRTLANLYKYMAIKAFAGSDGGRRHGCRELRYLLRIVRHDPAMLRHPVLLSMLFLKAALVILVSGEGAGRLLERLGRVTGWDNLQAIENALGLHFDISTD